MCVCVRMRSTAFPDALASSRYTRAFTSNFWWHGCLLSLAVDTSCVSVHGRLRVDVSEEKRLVCNNLHFVALLQLNAACRTPETVRQSGTHSTKPTVGTRNCSWALASTGTHHPLSLLFANKIVKFQQLMFNQKMVLYSVRNELSLRQEMLLSSCNETRAEQVEPTEPWRAVVNSHVHLYGFM